MKRIPLLIIKSFLTAVVAAPIALPLQAQSDREITANIPFPFIVSTRSITPGNYQFSLIIGSPLLLSIRSVKTGHQEFFPVYRGSQQAFESNGCLTFEKSNNNFSVLTNVYFPGTDTLVEVIGSRGVRRPQTKLCSNSEPLSLIER